MTPDAPAQKPEAIHRIFLKGFRWCCRLNDPMSNAVVPGGMWIRSPNVLYSVSRWWRLRRPTSYRIVKEGFVTNVVLYKVNGAVFANGQEVYSVNSK